MKGLFEFIGGLIVLAFCSFPLWLPFVAMHYDRETEIRTFYYEQISAWVADEPDLRHSVAIRYADGIITRRERDEIADKRLKILMTKTTQEIEN